MKIKKLQLEPIKNFSQNLFKGHIYQQFNQN